MQTDINEPKQLDGDPKEPSQPQFISRSPVPVSRVDQDKKPVELSFPDAIREVLNGRKITRLAWESNSTFGCLKDTFLMIFIRGEYHQWIVNDGDMNAIDWIVLPEPEQK